MESTDKKGVLKTLRAERKVYIDRARKTIKDNHRIIASIREAIAEAPKTIPEIADALGMDTAVVLLFVSGLKKYGEVTEGDKDGDYFKYGVSHA